MYVYSQTYITMTSSHLCLPHSIQVDSPNIANIGVTSASKKSQAADQNPIRSRNPGNLGEKGKLK